MMNMNMNENENENKMNEAILTINGEMFINMNYLLDRLVRYLIPIHIETWDTPIDGEIDRTVDRIVDFISDDKICGGLGMPERGRDLMHKYINTRYGAWLRERLKMGK